MDNKTFDNANTLFILNRCTHCNLTLFVGRINQKLPVKDMIHIEECEYYTRYGIPPSQRFLMYSKSLDGGFPCLFIHGRRVQGVNSQIEYETLLNAVFHYLYIVPEENKSMWHGENCHFENKGIFRGKVICN